MRWPVFHFVCIGALAFALVQWRAPTRSAPLPEFAADASDGLDAELLYRAGVALGLDRDDVVVQSRLLRNMRFLDRDGADRGTLYRDALRLGIGGSDVVVRRRVIERMTERLRAAGLADEPSEADLHAYLDAHGAAFRIPPRAAFTQLFFSRRLRGARVEADARAVRERLPDGGCDGAAARGDALPIALPAGPIAAGDVARLLGPVLARRILTSPAGRWSEPVSSPYGLHLICVTEHVPAVEPSFESLRPQLRAAVRDARADTALRDGMTALRAAYAQLTRSTENH